jgi:hypothetical protein
LNDGVAEGAGDRVRGVFVGGVGDDIDLTAFAAECVVAEPDAAVGELLAVVPPVRVASPAVVDGVAGEAWGSLVLCLERERLSSGERDIDAPAKETQKKMEG